MVLQLLRLRINNIGYVLTVAVAAVIDAAVVAVVAVVVSGALKSIPFKGITMQKLRPSKMLKSTFLLCSAHPISV